MITHPNFAKFGEMDVATATSEYVNRTYGKQKSYCLRPMTRDCPLLYFGSKFHLHYRINLTTTDLFITSDI